MNEVMTFENAMFGSLRTLYENDGNILYCGTDVASDLGYSNPRKAINNHCRYVTKRDVPHPQSPSKMIEMSFIPEGDVYRLIVRSKLPDAEKFEKWVFDEVLPQIRRTGAYSKGDYDKMELARIISDCKTATGVRAIMSVFDIKRTKKAQKTSISEPADIQVFVKEYGDVIGKRTKHVYEAYREWCDFNKFRPITHTQFTKEVIKLCHCSSDPRRIKGQTHRVFVKKM